jgi:hypothetical protein
MVPVPTILSVVPDLVDNALDGLPNSCHHGKMVQI